MVISIFLLFVAMFAVAGFFISLEAKRRNDGQAERPMAPRNDAPKFVERRSDGKGPEGSRARAA